MRDVFLLSKFATPDRIRILDEDVSKFALDTHALPSETFLSAPFEALDITPPCVGRVTVFIKHRSEDAYGAYINYPISPTVGYGRHCILRKIPANGNYTVLVSNNNHNELIAIGTFNPRTVFLFYSVDLTLPGSQSVAQQRNLAAMRAGFQSGYNHMDRSFTAFVSDDSIHYRTNVAQIVGGELNAFYANVNPGDVYEIYLLTRPMMQVTLLVYQGDRQWVLHATNEPVVVTMNRMNDEPFYWMRPVLKPPSVARSTPPRLQFGG